MIVWGAGAIGGTIGAYLIRAGYEVIFVDRDAEHVAAINQDGLRISGPIDAFTVSAAACLPQDLPAGPYQTVLLCVKAQDSRSAAESIRPYLAQDGFIVSVQNGLNELIIGEIVGPERTMGAFVNFGADYIEPGHIHRGNRATIVFGELDGSLSLRLQALHQIMLDFEPNAVKTENIWGYLWGKLAYGAQLFATALTNDSIADALEAPRYRGIYIELAREVMRVAAAQGITPEAFDGFNPSAFAPDGDRATAEASLDRLVQFNRGSAKTHSGIWRDLAVRKRRTEAEHQLGPIVTIAEAAGVSTPVLSRLIELIMEIEAGQRIQDHANLEDLIRYLPAYQ